MEEIQIDENIDRYQNCLDDDDRKWTTMAEENSRKYGIQTMLNNGYLQIKDGTMSGDHL